MMKIEVNTHGVVDVPTKIQVGNWVDLRSAEDVDLKSFEFRKISLGISMNLPDGYEAHVVPRSSTFEKWGILMTNSMGVIDDTYCGNDDIWRFPALAMRETHISKGDRICQFRIMKIQPELEFSLVEKLHAPNRGGFGTTGMR